MDISAIRFLAANFIFSLSPCHYKNGPYLIPAKNKHYFPKATLVITWPKRANIICGQIYLTNGVAERIVFTILIPIKAHVLTFMETNKVLLPSLCHCDLRVFVILYWLVFIHFWKPCIFLSRFRRLLWGWGDSARWGGRGSTQWPIILRSVPTIWLLQISRHFSLSNEYECDSPKLWIWSCKSLCSSAEFMLMGKNITFLLFAHSWLKTLNEQNTNYKYQVQIWTTNTEINAHLARCIPWNLQYCSALYQFA